jgi:hypothetical protein
MYCFAFFVSVRASESVPPPAAQGTTSVMSRSGNPAAWSGEAPSANSEADAAVEDTKRRLVKLMDQPSLVRLAIGSENTSDRGPSFRNAEW